MALANVERRLFQRVELSLPISVRWRDSSGEEKTVAASTSNISYTGAYFKTPEVKSIKREDVLSVAVAIPRESSRDFPFSRLVGKARVVRIEEKLQGIALEFARDFTRLAIA